MEEFKCPTCSKPLTEKQIRTAIRSGKTPKYCSAYCMNNRVREYEYDHTFLDSMTPFAAYFLGLFVTDGNLSKEVVLGFVDKQLIDDLIKFTKYLKPVNPQIRNSKPNKPFYRLRYFGNIPKRIMEMGYTPGVKTGKEFIPACITDELFPHFLRGAIDGDGTWHIQNKEYGYVNCGICCSNRNFLEDIWLRLQRLNIVKRGNLAQHSNRIIPFFSLHFGHADSQRIGDFIYKNAEIKLERKYEIYKSGIGRYIKQSQEGLICMIEDCENPVKYKNLCKYHYFQQKHLEYKRTHGEQIKEARRRYKRENREKINKQRRMKYAEDPEKHKKSCATWRDRNREKYNESARQRYYKDKESRLQYAQEYRETNREKIREEDRQRYAAKVGKEVRSCERQEGTCLVESCENEKHCKGLCKSHYGKMLKHKMTVEQFLAYKKSGISDKFISKSSNS